MKSAPDASVFAELLAPRLNALVLCLSNSWGGLEQVAASDALAIAELGLKTRFLCLEGSPIHEYLVHRTELEVIPLGFRPRNLFDFKLGKELERLIQDGVNLVHTHQTSLLASIVPWLWRRPTVALIATRHIMNTHNKRNFFHAAIYNRLDSLVVMSQALHENVTKTHSIRARRLRVVNLGLDFERFDPDKVDPSELRAAWGIEDGTTVIGLVGRIDPAKGQATLIQAAARIMKGLKPDEKIKFVIVGEETLGSVGRYLDELKEMVTQFRLDEVIVFAGYHEDIPKVMRAFDIVVMPSRQEAFGLVAIEAMAMQRPIIISSGGSAEEIVGSDEFGLTVRPDDAFDLHHKIRYFLDHPLERTKMAARARVFVKKSFDRKVRVMKMLEIYDQALRRRGVG